MLSLPIAKEGRGIITAATLLLGILALVLSFVVAWAWVLPLVIWLWVVSFFRDPNRPLEQNPSILYSPADGLVTEVTELDHHDKVDGPAIRIRIFLSIFNVHINRMPCAATVQSVEFKPGKFLNALRPASMEENEHTRLTLQPSAPWQGRIVVRQIAGAIAKTIVCHADAGSAFESGARFGMIKFGSGTEIIFPRQASLTVLVTRGQKVRAGVTRLAKLENEQDASATGQTTNDG